MRIIFPLCLWALGVKAFYGETLIHFDFNDQIIGTAAGAYPMLHNETSGPVSWATLQGEAAEDQQEELVFDRIFFTPNGMGGTSLTFAGNATVDQHLSFGPIEERQGITLFEVGIRFDSIRPSAITLLEDKDPLTGKVAMAWELDALGRLIFSCDDGQFMATSLAVDLAVATWHRFQVAFDPEGTELADTVRFYHQGQALGVNINESVFAPFVWTVTSEPIRAMLREKEGRIDLDYLRWSNSIENVDPLNFYLGERYVDPDASIGLIAPGAFTLRRTAYSLSEINGFGFYARQTKRLDESLYDRHEEGIPGVFHGVFEINLALETHLFDEEVSVEVFVQKPGEVWKKILEVQPETFEKPKEGLWWLNAYWDSREPAFDWTEEDAGTPYRSETGLRLKFKVR